MKCIVSVWYQHVYALQKDELNEWSKVFPYWSICTKRNGRFLERLKLTNYQDQDNFNDSKSKKQDFAFYELLRTFLEYYINNQKKARECAVSFLCTVWCHQVNSLKNKEDESTNLLQAGMDDMGLNSNNDTETEEENSTMKQPPKKKRAKRVKKKQSEQNILKITRRKSLIENKGGKLIQTMKIHTNGLIVIQSTIQTQV